MNELATKKNLLEAKYNLSLAQKGHDLLEIKYAALLRELKTAKKRAEKIRSELEGVLAEAEHARVVAEMEIGEGIMGEILAGLENAAWSEIINEPEAARPLPPYKLNETCASTDEAYFAWARVYALQKKLAEAEAAAAELKARTTRIKKRVSALGNVLIPKYGTRIKYISGKLEENERDEMIRRKTVCR